MLKYSLVPTKFFSKEESYRLLSDVVALERDEAVAYKELPGFQAVLLYSAADAQSGSKGLSLVIRLLDVLSFISGYTKVAASYDGEYLHIAISSSEKLLLCNSFGAADEVTAQYYIFAALRQFQINPEGVNIHLYGDVPQGMVSDLKRYFQEVTLCE